MQYLFMLGQVYGKNEDTLSSTVDTDTRLIALIFLNYNVRQTTSSIIALQILSVGFKKIYHSHTDISENYEEKPGSQLFSSFRGEE